MQSSKPLFVLVSLILAAVVGGCVGVITSSSIPTPRVGELPMTQTVSARVQAPVTLSNGDSVAERGAMYSLDEMVQQAKKYAEFFPNADAITLTQFVNFLANRQGIANILEPSDLLKERESLRGLTRDEVREIAHDETLKILRNCLDK